MILYILKNHLYKKRRKMSCITYQPFTGEIPSDLIPYITETGDQAVEKCMGVQNPGGNVTLSDEFNWLQAWNSGNCSTFLDKVPFQKSQEMMSFILSRYYSDHEFTLEKYSVGTIENNMLNVCSDYPGSCQIIQGQMCTNCDNQEISQSYELTRFCGCFSSTPVAQGLSPECQPLCSMGNSIKLVDKNAVPLECNETICVIDNVSVQASNTSFNNSSITQVCGNCAISGGCKCFIESSIENLAYQLGITGTGNTFRTYCTDSECFVIDEATQETREVSCASFNRTVSTLDEINIPKIVWVIFGVIIFLGVIIVLCFYLWGLSFKMYYFRIWKPKPINTTGLTSQSFD